MSHRKGLEINVGFKGEMWPLISCYPIIILNIEWSLLFNIGLLSPIRIDLSGTLMKLFFS